jgi:hypothetical protein
LETARLKRDYDTTSSGRVGAVRRQVSSVLGFAVLLLNIWAGIAVAARSSHADPFLAAFAEGRIVICTGSGMLVVDHDGRPVDSSAPGSGHGSDIHCQFCLPLMHGMSAPPVSPVAVVIEQVHLIATLPRSAVTTPARTFLSSVSARAPPQG